MAVSSYNELLGLGSHSEHADVRGWWPLMDSAANTTVDDASSNANDGTLGGGNNTADIAVTGPNSFATSALDLDGSSDNIDFGADPVGHPGTSGWTAFVRFKNDVTTGTRFLLAMGNDTSSFGEGWCIFVGTTALIVRCCDASSNRRSQSVSFSDTTSFHDVALVLDRTTNTITGYLDGSNSGWSAGGGGPTDDDITGFNITDSSSTNLYGGQRQDGNNRWNGEISEIIVFANDDDLAEVRGGPEPVNSVAPAISGTEEVGQTLSCTTGTWGLGGPWAGGSNGTVTYAYQWTRSNDAGGTGEADISGATSSNYTLVSADAGKFIRCRVAASNDGGNDSAADTNSDMSGEITGPPSLDTITIAASGTSITLVFSENVTGQTAGYSLTATDGAVTLSSPTGDGTPTHGYTLSRTIGSHETVTLSYDSGTGSSEDDDSNALASITDQAVTNNSTQDTVAPTLSTKTIDELGLTLTLVFDENVTGQTGFSVSSDGGSLGITADSGDGTDTHTFTFDRYVLDTETVTVSYSGGTSVDDAGNALATITNSAVTNNSLQESTSRPTARPTYTGHPKIAGLTAITPKITCCRASGYAPFAVQVSAELTTADGGDPYLDLHYEWDFGDTSGSEIAKDHYTDRWVNLNDSQTGPEAAYVYRTAGSYTITLTATGKNNYGQLVTASTTTVLRLAEYECWLANATGGTFTLTVEVDGDGGETTAAIAYDAGDDSYESIAIAVQALSNVGATGVRHTMHKTLQFIGDLAANDSVTVTLNSSLTGTSGTPAAIERFAPSSNSTVTCNARTGWTEGYFDSGAAGGGDGSEGTPWNSAADLLTFIDSDGGGDYSNRIAYIKRGSTFALTDHMKIGRGHKNIHIEAYGSGAKPILTDTGSSAVQASHLFVETEHSSSYGITTSDIVISNLDIRAGQALHAVWFGSTTNGTASNQLIWTVGCLVDNCDFTRTGGSESLLRCNGQTRMQGFTTWNCSFDGGTYVQLANFAPSVGSWQSCVGDSHTGMDADATRDHFIYPGTEHHSLYRYLSFGAATSLNFCINTTAHGYGANWCHLMDGNDFNGPKNLVDFSNVNNDYVTGTPPETSHFDEVIVQFNLFHSRLELSQHLGIVTNNIYDICVRYNDFWDNAGHMTNGDANTVWKIYHNNFHGTSGISTFNESDNSFMWDNRVHVTGTNEAIQFDSSQMDIETWDIDGTTFYAPSASAIAEDLNGSTTYTFAQWQSTFSHDTNGQYADPSFSDPSNGIMEYGWTAPSFDAVGDTVSGIARVVGYDVAGNVAFDVSGPPWLLTQA